LSARSNGQVVVLVGEPGIGKSRLVIEFERRIVADSHTRSKQPSFLMSMWINSARRFAFVRAHRLGQFEGLQLIAAVTLEDDADAA